MRFTLLGVGLGLAVWFVESAFHAYVLGDGSLGESLACGRNGTEIATRTLTLLVFLGFGHVVDRLLGREQVLRASLERLTGMLEENERAYAGARLPNGGGPHEVESPSISGLIRLTGGGGATKTMEGVRGLLDVTARLALSSRLDEAMSQLYDTLREVIPYDRIGLSVLSPTPDTVTAIWARSEYSSRAIEVGYSAPLAGSSLEALLHARKPRVLNDLEAYLDAHPNSTSTRRILSEGVRSSLTCPLYSQGRPLGFVFFSSRKPNVYKEAHAVRFQLVARHVAAVVDRGLQHQLLLDEKKRSEALLLNVIPRRFVRRIQDGEIPVVEYHDRLGVMFIDIVSFTALVERFPAEEIATFLQGFFAALDAVMKRHRVEKIKTIGDAYMVIAPGSNGGLEALCAAALEARDRCAALRGPDGRAVAVRTAIAVGPALGGVLEQTKFAYDIWGTVVNRAARLCEIAGIGEILVTREISDHLLDHCTFENAGGVDIRGVGRLETFRLLGHRRATPSDLKEDPGSRRSP